MMKRRLDFLAAAIALFAAPHTFACDYPNEATIPDGGTASKEEMLEGQRNVKEYVAAMEAYLECIVAEDRAARSQMENLEPEDEQRREDMLNQKYNAAVDAMEAVAANFNAEVQAFRNRDQ